MADKARFHAETEVCTCLAIKSVYLSALPLSVSRSLSLSILLSSKIPSYAPQSAQLRLEVCYTVWEFPLPKVKLTNEQKLAL